MSRGLNCCVRYREAITSRCPSGFGAITPSDRPSLFTAEPLMTARMASRLRSALASGLSMTAPAPSPGTKPSAAASNTRQRPVGESAPERERSKYGVGVSSRLTPPAIAMSHSPRRRLSQARCTATSEAEQAVSTARLGPLRFRVCDVRAAIMLRRLLTAV
jgi:hypothetical protein